jgi:GTP cyclohydrolase I
VPDNAPELIKIGTMSIVKALGIPKEEGDTATRAAQWFQSFARYPSYEDEEDKFLSTTFNSPHQELIMVSHLRFISLCPHHLLPYSGEAAIGYLPGAPSNTSRHYKVVGLSKLARALWYWTHWPVKQEDSTAMIADALMEFLGAAGAMVVMKAYHTCMGFRGVMQESHQTTTSAARGAFLTDANGIRQEFLKLMGP